MTLDEVVIALQVSRQYIYKMRKNGTLIPIISDKGTNIYLKDDVISYANRFAEKYAQRLAFTKDFINNKLTD